MQCVSRPAQLEALEVGCNGGNRAIEAAQDPPVCWCEAQLLLFFIALIAQHCTRQVPDFIREIAGLLNALWREADLLLLRAAGRHQAEAKRVGAILTHQVERVDAGTE